jgi:hypothetical protein
MKSLAECRGFFCVFYHAVFVLIVEAEVVLLRTKRGWKPEKLSEVGAASDKTGMETEEVVRSGCCFGQNGDGNRRSCPKRVLLQTKRGWKSKKLSEEGAASDKTGMEIEEVVRRGCCFGQNGVGNRRSCLKWVLLRTGPGCKSSMESKAERILILPEPWSQINEVKIQKEKYEN